MFSYTSLSTGITSLFFFIAGLQVISSWLKTKSALVKYFAIFLFSFSLQQLFFSLGTGFLTLNITINSYLWAGAHIFMFVSISYFIRIPLHAYSVRLEKIVFILSLAYAAIGSAVLFLNVSNVGGYLAENRIYIYEVPSLSIAVIVIFTTITLLFAAVSFIYSAIKTKERFVRWRAIFITIGIFIYLTAGPAHNLTKSPILTFFACSLLVVSTLFMITGVYIYRILPKPQTNL